MRILAALFALFLQKSEVHPNRHFSGTTRRPFDNPETLTEGSSLNEITKKKPPAPPDCPGWCRKDHSKDTPRPTDDLYRHLFHSAEPIRSGDVAFHRYRSDAWSWHNPGVWTVGEAVIEIFPMNGPTTETIPVRTLREIRALVGLAPGIADQLAEMVDQWWGGSVVTLCPDCGQKTIGERPCMRCGHGTICADTGCQRVVLRVDDDGLCGECGTGAPE